MVKKIKRLKHLSLVSTILILLLFFLGGLVRATGSGMGCPDWPKCFGQIIPPTSEKQLPENYQNYYLEKRKIKLNRLVNILNTLGLEKKANSIMNEPYILEAHPFNVQKAYIEYINRVVGVITGIVVLLTLIAAFRISTTATLLALGGFLSVVINSFLGAIVVQTNLLQGLVSLHYIFALIAVLFFVVIFRKSQKNQMLVKTSKSVKIGMIFLLGLLFIQILFGTAIRSATEDFLKNGLSVSQENYHLLGNNFLVHRILSLMVVFALCFLWFRKKELEQIQVKTIIFLLVVSGLQILTGSLNLTKGFPIYTQVIHIAFASILWVSSIYLLMVSSISPFKLKNNV